MTETDPRAFTVVHHLAYSGDDVSVCRAMARTPGVVLTTSTDEVDCGECLAVVQAELDADATALVEEAPGRQCCCRCIASVIPTVTVKTDDGRRFHFCADHADQADMYAAYGWSVVRYGESRVADLQAEELATAPADAEAPETAPAEARFATREEYLVEAVKLLAPIFEEVGEQLPPVRVSVGFAGGRGKRSSTIGQCWSTSAATDGVAQLFVSPVLVDAPVVLDTLAHELVHAVDDCKHGHKGRFVEIAKKIDLTDGKPTQAGAGPELKARLAEVSKVLGAYPHAALSSGAAGAEGPKPQKNRHMKVACAEGSGYFVRMSRGQMEAFGMPLCPCHEEQMVEA